MRKIVLILAGGIVACAGHRPPAPSTSAAGSPAPRAAAADSAHAAAPGSGGLSTPKADPFPSTYAPSPRGRRSSAT